MIIIVSTLIIFAIVMAPFVFFLGKILALVCWLLFLIIILIRAYLNIR